MGSRGGFNFDPFDFFGFGGQENDHRESEPEKRQGPDFIVPLEVSLEDIFAGKEFQVIMTKPTLCHRCHGTGADSEDSIQTCPKCRGHGVYMRTVHVAPGFIQQFQSSCDECGGRGKVVKKVCSLCKGHKIHDDVETISVKVPRGAKNGERITLAGQASDYVDQLASDLVFVVKRK